MSLDQKLQQLLQDLEKEMNQMDLEDERIAAIDLLHEKAERAAKIMSHHPTYAQEVYDYASRRFQQIQKERRLDTV
jgi:hypothetical protein